MSSERESDQSTGFLGESDPGEGYEPWPRDWSGGGAVGDERALREHREGLIRGRIRGGARWEVPVRAAVAAACMAFVVVAVVVGLLLRSRGRDEGVSIGESAPLISTSVASAGPSASGPGGVAGAVPSAAPAVDSPVAVAGAAGQSRVYVVGQVRRPGVVSLGSDARVQDAIEAAGGATGRADLARINLARKVVDGERILVPKPGQKLEDDPAVGGGSAGVAGGDSGGVTSGAAGGAPGTPIDLNTATVTELDALPGVGPVLAGRIVEWRQSNGRFTTVDDLNEVSGIGDATMEKLRPMVRV
jgi:competence protein ComEA